jgi:hypothetical protein
MIVLGLYYHHYSFHATNVFGLQPILIRIEYLMRISDIFQDQIKKNGSDAGIKMFGDVPIAAGWWSWLFR